MLPFSRRSSRAPQESSPAIAATALTAIADEADVVELVSESEISIVDFEPSTRDLEAQAAVQDPQDARDLPSVEVIFDEEASLPAIAIASEQTGPESAPIAIEAIEAEREREVFVEEDPTVRLGTLPPPPFPRHLAPASVPPPAPGVLRLGGVLVPMEFLPGNASSSLSPMAMDSTSELESRRMPTMRIRASGEEPSIVVVRGRPNVLWGAALLVLGIVGGVVGSHLVVAPADDVVRNGSVLTSPPTLAAPAAAPIAPAKATETANAAVAAINLQAQARPHVEPASASPIEAPVRATKPVFAATAAWVPPSSASPTSAPSGSAASTKPAVASPVVAKAPQAAAPAAPSLAKKAPPAVASAQPVAAVSPVAPKGKTALPANELANDQATDALARAQLKASLR